MKKEDIISEFFKTVSLFNRTKTFMQFQMYMKGENILLMKLAELGESTPSELMKELGMTGPRVTAILHSLELKKLVEKTANQKDKRKTHVKITSKGESWVELSNDNVLGKLNDVIDKLGEEDTKELIRILKKILLIPASDSLPLEKTNDSNGYSTDEQTDKLTDGGDQSDEN